MSRCPSRTRRPAPALPFRAPVAALAACLALTLAPAARAQDPVWMPLTAGAAPGQPAEIVFDATASGGVDSFFDVYVPGYWSQVVTPGDGFTYERIEVPGLARHGQEGAPDLPRAVLRVAVPTSAPSVAVSATDLDPRVIPGILPYPFEIQELDGGEDEDGTPAIFVLDAAIYAGTGIWPATPAPASAPVTTRLGTIRSAEVPVSLARWNPTSGDLTLSAHTRVHIQAPGSAAVFPAITKDRAALAAQTFPNWPEQFLAYPVEPDHFSGRYLIVIKENALGEVEDFIQHKTLQGFDVDVLLLDSLPFVGCGELRAAIGDWYEAGDPSADHYCLLVGDDQTVPQCSSPTMNPKLGDDLYGSPIDGDLEEEIFVGRLTYDAGDTWRIGAQLDRIMAYELDFNGDHYGEALLVANLEDAPGKYQGNCQAVVDAEYAVEPEFTTIFGSQVGSTDANVISAINAGKGLVTYRGHGGPTSWSSWNLVNQSFGADDVVATITGSKRPVVWSFSCWNNKLTTEDSIGEAWMEEFYTGAVAHYGSTDISGTKQNHRLNLHMHDAVFDLGLVRHGHAIAWAEQNMAADEPGVNSWMYLLLGDPSMRVRRGAAKLLKLELPETIPVGGGGAGSTWSVTVTDAGGMPQADVLVTISQPAAGTGGPALFANQYTDASGEATFDEFPLSIQYLVDVGASDPFGNQAIGSLGTASGVWANLGGGLKGKLGKPALVGEGPLTPNSNVSMDLTSGNENAFGALLGSIGSQPTPFKGGTLVTVPVALLVELNTDAQGEVHLQANWPAGIPSDLDLWFQFAIQDPEAVAGVSLSNALRAITP